MGNAICGINEYADSRGIPRGTFKGIIKSAESRGKAGIVFGYDDEKKKVYPDILDKEWFLRYRMEQEAKGKVFMPKTVGAELAVMDVGDTGATKASDWKFKNAVELPGENGGVVNFGFKGGPVDFLEAQRVWMLNKARREKLEADEKEGILVRKDAINSQLHTAGIEVRKAMEQLPVQCVDDIRAAKTRPEALMVLEDAVRNTLEKMGVIITKVLNEKEQ